VVSFSHEGVYSFVYKAVQTLLPRLVFTNSVRQKVAIALCVYTLLWTPRADKHNKMKHDKVLNILSKQVFYLFLAGFRYTRSYTPVIFVALPR
jgi:hypothetical protein